MTGAGGLRLPGISASADKLSSSQRKLARGIEHVETLCGEAAAFENDRAYVFKSERKPRSAQEVEYRCFAVQRKTMPEHWPLLAGEAIQNLRSALDHFIHEVSGGKPRTQFPIFTDPCEFQVFSPKMMKGVPKPVRARIERLQPYRRSPGAPTQDALAQLNTLSNLDKHRVLTAFASAVTDEGMGLPEGIELTWEETGTDKHLGPGETYVSTFVVRAKDKAVDMDVQPLFSYEVRIQGRPVQTLDWIARQVRWVLTVCSGDKLIPVCGGVGRVGPYLPQ